MAIGFLTMDSDTIVGKGKGEAIEVIEFMNDALWTLKPVWDKLIICSQSAGQISTDVN